MWGEVVSVRECMCIGEFVYVCRGCMCVEWCMCVGECVGEVVSVHLNKNIFNN